MKPAFYILTLLMLVACGSNQVTEVGNPTATSKPKDSALAAATTSALTKSQNGLLDQLRNVRGGADAFDCSYSASAQSMTCSCDGGGTMTTNYSSTFSQAGGTYSFDQSYTLTLDDCVVTACAEELTLAGTVTGSTTGSYNPATGATTMTTVQETAAACSGLTINDVAVGLAMTMSFDDDVTEFTGSLCLDGEAVSFTDLAELQASVDSENACSETFNSL